MNIDNCHMNSLIIDVREAGVSSPTGKGLWTYHCISELIKKEIPLLLLTDRPLAREWNTAAHVRIRQFSRGILWHVAVWFFLCRQKPGTKYISPTSFIVPAFLPCRIRCFPVVHDLIAFHDEPHNRKATFIERLLLSRCLKRAAFVFTISESTKKDLIKRFPWMDGEKISMVGAGPTMMKSEIRRQRSEIKRKHILCIGTLCPRKNQLRLIEAFSKIDTDAQLILIGSRGWHDADIIRKVKETPRVCWLGYVSDEQLQEFLETSTLFAFPSLYEGFGFPVLDAMILGIPVLTSRRGSLEEVAGDAAVFVDPEDVFSIGDGLKKLLSDESLRRELQEKGLQRAKSFSWKHVIEKILDCITLPS